MYEKLCAALQNDLENQDLQRGDLSIRIEGMFKAIGILARTLSPRFTQEQRIMLRDAIVRACKTFKQVDTISKWPSNRFALSALAELGCDKPVAVPACA